VGNKLAKEFPIRIDENEKWVQVIALTTEPIKYQEKIFKTYREELDYSRKRFIGIPIYLDHERTDDDFLGTVSDSFFTQDKILLRLNLLSETETQKKILSKIKDGKIKNVSLSFSSCDIPYLNEIIMTDIQPKEISILSKMEPVCPSCNIFEKNFATPEDVFIDSLFSETQSIYLIPPHGQMISRGEKTLIVQKKFFKNMVGKEMFLVSGSWCWGTIILKNPKKITLDEFKKLRLKHQIIDSERKSQWGSTKIFYSYPFIARMWQVPKKVKMKQTTPPFGRVEFEEKLIKEIKDYYPAMLPIKVLHDDMRIAMAWYSSKKEGKEIKFSFEEIEEVCKKIIRELLKRNKEGRKGQITVFHPEKMKKYSKELFEKTMKKIKKDSEIKDYKNLDNETNISTGEKMGKFLEVTPSDDHFKGKNIKLEDFEHDWDKSAMLIENFITIVGGECNYEKDGTTGDIDVLLDMPRESFLNTPVLFRLYRAIKDREIANRLSFHYSDDKDFKSPFTNHKHKYHLMLVPSGDEKVHQMGLKEIETPIISTCEDLEKKEESLDEPKIRTEKTDIISDAQKSSKEDKVVPFRFFYQMKPMHGRTIEEFYTIDGFFKIFTENNLDWTEKGVYIERKADGQTAQIHKLGDKVRIWLEDGGEVTQNLPSIVNSLQKEKNDFIILAETELWEDGKRMPRAESNGILHSKELNLREKNIRLALYDILWFNGKDIHNLNYSERQKIYSSFKENDNLWVNPHHFTKNENEFKTLVKKMSKKDYAEGAIVKVANFSYNLSRRPDKGFVKYKNEFSLIVKVIGKHKVEGTEKTYFYYCAIKDEKNNDVFVGKTFNTNIDKNIGEKIRVIFTDISKYFDPEKKLIWFEWWSPRCTDDEKIGEPFSTVKVASVLVEKTTGRIMEKKLPKYEEIVVKPEGILVEEIEEEMLRDPYMEIPDENKTYNYVAQHHHVRKSVHTDLRFGTDDHCIGWTIDDAIEGEITSPVLTLSDAKKWDAKPIFKIDWKKGKMRKTLSKFGKPVDVKLLAETKAVAKGKDWLVFEGVQPIGKPGSSRNFPGVFNILDKGRVEWGCAKSYYREYFLSGGKLKGTIIFRLLKNIWKIKPPKQENKIFGEEKYPEIFIIGEKDGDVSAWVPVEYLEKKFAEEKIPKTGKGEFVWFMFIKSPDEPPYVLSRRAVKTGWMPQKGISSLPSLVRKKIPEKYHYWKINESSKRKEIRDELVSLIKKHEVKLSDEDVKEKENKKMFPFILHKHYFKGQHVIRWGVSSEEWELRIDVGKSSLVHFIFNKNPIENKNVAGILKICKNKSSMEVGKKGIERFEPGHYWNPTKNTPAFVEALDWGEVEILEESENLKKFNFYGKKLKGLFGALREDKSDIWNFSKNLDGKKFGKIKIHGCAIKAGVLNSVYYSPEVIKNAKRSLYNREITIDHAEDVSVRNIVGRTTNVFFRKNALYFDGIIYDNEIAKKIKQKLIKGCSVRMKVLKNPNEKIAKRIEFINVSLVIGPACKETKIEVR